MVAAENEVSSPNFTSSSDSDSDVVVGVSRDSYLQSEGSSGLEYSEYPTKGSFSNKSFEIKERQIPIQILKEPCDFVGQFAHTPISKGLFGNELAEDNITSNTTLDENENGLDDSGFREIPISIEDIDKQPNNLTRPTTFPGRLPEGIVSDSTNGRTFRNYEADIKCNTGGSTKESADFHGKGEGPDEGQHLIDLINLSKNKRQPSFKTHMPSDPSEVKIIHTHGSIHSNESFENNQCIVREVPIVLLKEKWKRRSSIHIPISLGSPVIENESTDNKMNSENHMSISDATEMQYVDPTYKEWSIPSNNPEITSKDWSLISNKLQEPTLNYSSNISDSTVNQAALASYHDGSNFDGAGKTISRKRKRKGFFARLNNMFHRKRRGPTFDSSSDSNCDLDNFEDSGNTEKEIDTKLYTPIEALITDSSFEKSGSSLTKSSSEISASNKTFDFSEYFVERYGALSSPSLTEGTTQKENSRIKDDTEIRGTSKQQNHPSIAVDAHSVSFGKKERQSLKRSLSQECKLTKLVVAPSEVTDLQHQIYTGGDFLNRSKHYSENENPDKMPEDRILMTEKLTEVAPLYAAITQKDYDKTRQTKSNKDEAKIDSSDNALDKHELSNYPLRMNPIEVEDDKNTMHVVKFDSRERKRSSWEEKRECILEKLVMTDPDLPMPDLPDNINTWSIPYTSADKEGVSTIMTSTPKISLEQKDDALCTTSVGIINK